MKATVVNAQIVAEIFGDSARLEGSVVIVECTKAEERKMLANWLMALSFADELGREWYGLGWSNGEVRMEPIE